jgi:hypothetical protein
MKKISSLLFAILLFGITSSITGAQVNEPVRAGIEKIAEAPPGIVATCEVNFSDNLVQMLPGDSRLISAYEKTGTTFKPHALVMADYTTLVATDISGLSKGSLFLPISCNHQYKYLSESGNTSKPHALVMADYTTLVATDISVLSNRSLFLPISIDQVEEILPA